MAGRAIWKGVLHFGEHRLPVKLYSAVTDPGVHFQLLAPKAGAPVHQQLVDPSTDEIVPYAEVKRGFPVPEGFVVLEKEELESLVPEATRDVSITRFLPAQKLGPEWLVRPYFVGPDGESEAYFAFARALADGDEQGLARWVMRDHEYHGVLQSIGGYLMLTTLRHADEVIRREELPRPEGRPYNAQERKMAEQLVEAYSGDFDPSAHHDEYRARVLAFVEAKQGGKHPKLAKVVSKREDTDLSAALEKSLASMKKSAKDERAAPAKAGRSAKKAGARTRASAKTHARKAPSSSRKERHVA